MTRSTLLRQGLFATAMTLALGFGTMEALAAPGATADAAACTATWAAKCNQLCTDQGYDYGVCDSATGRCICGWYPLDN